MINERPDKDFKIKKAPHFVIDNQTNHSSSNNSGQVR